jgi:hypothetical protein
MLAQEGIVLQPRCVADHVVAALSGRGVGRATDPRDEADALLADEAQAGEGQAPMRFLPACNGRWSS